MHLKNKHFIALKENSGQFQHWAHFFLVHLECFQYRQKQQKSVLTTPCYLFNIHTLLTSMGHVLNLLFLAS